MRRLNILHIEDDREDALLLAKACQAVNLQADFTKVSDGNEAIRYLNRNGHDGEDGQKGKAKHPLPDVIVLDLKLPGMNGFEFLGWLRQQSAFRSMPVLVFTQSRVDDDKSRAIAAGATGYFVKPIDFPSLIQLAESFKKFA